jgi:hypothetical protein
MGVLHKTVTGTFPAERMVLCTFEWPIHVTLHVGAIGEGQIRVSVTQKRYAPQFRCVPKSTLLMLPELYFNCVVADIPSADGSVTEGYVETRLEHVPFTYQQYLEEGEFVSAPEGREPEAYCEIDLPLGGMFALL